MNRISPVHQRRLFVGLTLTALVLGWESADAAADSRERQKKSDIKIEVTMPPQTMREHGYVVYRVKISNISQADQTVSLKVPATRVIEEGSSLPSITSLEVEPVNVKAGKSHTVSLLHPPLPISGRNLHVVVDGVPQKDWIRLDPVLDRAGRPQEYNERYADPDAIESSVDAARFYARYVLISQGFQSERSHVDFFDTRIPWQYEPWKYEVVQQRSDLWSNNWLAYSGFDVVALTANEWDAADEAVRNALTGYLSCGGHLLIMGRPSQNLPNHKGQGFGRFTIADPSDVDMEMSDLGAHPWEDLAERIYESGRGYYYGHNEDGFNSSFEIVESLSVPVAGLLVLMVLFVVAAGPGSLSVLTRLKRRIWLLWVVPALALLTCVCITVYSIVAEGFEATVRTSAITYLDQTTGTTATIGWQAYYSPLTPRQGLRFDSSTEVTPLYVPDEFSRGERTIKLAEREQQFATGWVASRVPAHFLIRKAESQRDRRLDVDFGSREATNKLGLTVKKMIIADENGSLFASAKEDIADGDTVRLESSDAISTEQGVRPLSELYHRYFLSPTNWRSRDERGDEYDYNYDYKYDYRYDYDRLHHLEDVLGPGMYIAWLATPFVEEGMQGRRKPGTNVVIGIWTSVSSE